MGSGGLGLDFVDLLWRRSEVAVSRDYGKLVDGFPSSCLASESPRDQDVASALRMEAARRR
jgi:hypothetical protein